MAREGSRMCFSPAVPLLQWNKRLESMNHAISHLLAPGRERSSTDLAGTMGGELWALHWKWTLPMGASIESKYWTGGF
jgi:hypothetical protein